jgi:hypothetical protein
LGIRDVSLLFLITRSARSLDLLIRGHPRLSAANLLAA